VKEGGFEEEQRSFTFESSQNVCDVQVFRCIGQADRAIEKFSSETI
jgi:hypothetical protein